MREARRLRAAGLDTQRRGGPASIRQAIDYFERSVAADPALADAWGDLAYARYGLFDYSPDPERERLMRSARGAAERALRLQPGNRQALLTLALIKPRFRNWIEAERELRMALKRLPDEPQLHQRMGLLHADTGRWQAARAEFRWLDKREPLVPEHSLLLARALWHSGERKAAEALFARAEQLWPAEPQVWLARFNFLLLTGRPGEALSMTERNPFGLGGQSPLPREVAEPTARALATRAKPDIVKAVDAISEARRKGRVASFIVIPYLATLGATELVWDVLHAYYLGTRDPVSGERQPLPAFAGRRTDILFTAATAPLRVDSRFPRLTAALGLDAYWRATGAGPDRQPG